MANSAYRQVYILMHLLRHVPLTKQQLSKHFGVTERSIQRDISQLNALFDNEEVNQEVQYNQRSHAFELQTSDSGLTSAQLVVLIKILLASRALTSTETKQLINNLMQNALPSERRVINRVVQNEVFNYLPLHHDQPLTNLLWQFSLIITRGQVVELTYHSHTQQLRTHVIVPKAILFSEHYFYLIASDLDRNEERFYRFDRFAGFRIMKCDTPTNGYAARFPEGELRRYLPVMAAGEKVEVTFDYWGDPELALDWLPTATVIATDTAAGKVTIAATAYSEALKRWLLSQGTKALLLTPTGLVADLRGTIDQLYAAYHRN